MIKSRIMQGLTKIFFPVPVVSSCQPLDPTGYTPVLSLGGFFPLRHSPLTYPLYVLIMVTQHLYHSFSRYVFTSHSPPLQIRVWHIDSNFHLCQSIFFNSPTRNTYRRFIVLVHKYILTQLIFWLIIVV